MDGELDGVGSGDRRRPEREGDMVRQEGEMEEKLKRMGDGDGWRK